MIGRAIIAQAGQVGRIIGVPDSWLLLFTDASTIIIVIASVYYQRHLSKAGECLTSSVAP